MVVPPHLAKTSNVLSDESNLQKTYNFVHVNSMEFKFDPRSLLCSYQKLELVHRVAWNLESRLD